MTPSVASVTLICSDSNHSSSKSAALCVKIFTSADDFFGARPRKLAQQLQVVDEIAEASAAEIAGGVVRSRLSTTCEIRSS